MASFPGRFQLAGGRAPLQGTCTLSFDDETLQVMASGQPAVACDLGDIDVFAVGDCVLDLTLYTGQRLQLQQFGKLFDTVANELLAAHRARVVQCLLLEDLEELSRYTGTIRLDGAASRSSTAEIRVYKSNVAFLPVSAPAFHWRLADVEGVEFDATTYGTTIRSRDAAVIVTKLAKRTEEFRERLQAAIDDVGQRTATVLQTVVPCVLPTRFAELAALMREGHSASLAALDRIDPRISQAIVANVVDAKQRGCYEALASLAGKDATFTGFKMIRREEQDEEASVATEADVVGAGADAEDGRGAEPIDGPSTGDEDVADPTDPEDQQPVLHWFFFRIAPPAARQPMVAWESTSRGGRATYVFREAALAENSGDRSPERSINKLGAGLALVNFRREPIYLSDESLAMEARFRRYAIAARRLPELRALRSALVGRAIHSSPDAWRRQLDGLIR